MLVSKQVLNDMLYYTVTVKRSAFNQFSDVIKIYYKQWWKLRSKMVIVRDHIAMDGTEVITSSSNETIELVNQLQSFIKGNDNERTSF